jgi:hypothetical protein
VVAGGIAVTWELWWQITIWIVLVTLCAAFVKGMDSGKGPK